MRFDLSKVSRVGMTIRREQAQGRPRHERERLPRRARIRLDGATSPGTYDVTLSGTDLAGNVGRAGGTIEVLPARRTRREPACRALESTPWPPPTRTAPGSSPARRRTTPPRAEHGYRVIGLKERNRNRALEIVPGDRIVLYLTRIMAFAASIRVTGELYEDREKIWPGQARQPPTRTRGASRRSPSSCCRRTSGCAPRRSSTSSSTSASGRREHWKLAFQGQIRAVSEHDADVLHGAHARRGSGARMSEQPGVLARDRARVAGADARRTAGRHRVALALFLSMFLPWYGCRAERVVADSVSAFGAFSFVEAAVLLVALAVLALLFARSEHATFHLPGGDGTVVMAAGVWVALLLVWRLFDKPDADGALVGVAVGHLLRARGAGRARLRRLADAALAAAAGPAARATAHPDRGPAAPPPAPGTTATQVLPPERPRAGAPRVRRRTEDQLTIPLPPPDEPG